MKAAIPVRPLLLASLALTPLTLASAQGYGSTQTEVIAAWGDDAPGLPGVKLLGTFGIDNAVIDASGNVLFRAELVGTGITSTNGRAYFRGSSRDDLQLVIQGGDPAPGLPGLVLASTSSSGLSSSYRITPGGMAMFSSRLDGAGVTSSNDSALFAETPTGFELVIREGDPAPGTVGATITKSFSSFSQQGMLLNDAGRVLFKSTLGGGDVVSGVNDEAWFTGTPGAIELLAREGDTVLGTETIDSLDFLSQMNGSGAVLYDAKLVHGGTTDASNDKTVWLYVPGLGSSLVVRELDPAPGTVGSFFGNTFLSWSAGIGTGAFDQGGFFTMTAELVGGDVIPGVNDRALYKSSIGGHTMLARKGDPAPGTAAVWSSWNNTNTTLNNNGTIATQGNLGAPATEGDDTGVWIDRGAGFELVAREGDEPPGMPGFLFSSFSGKQILLNDRDQLVLSVSVYEILSGLTTNTLWTWDPDTGLRHAWSANDPLEVSPGTTKNVTSWSHIGFTTTNTGALSFSHDGKLAERFGLSDGTEAVGVLRLGNFTSKPEVISNTDGGTHEMFLDAGDAHAGKLFLVLGSAGGSTPGIPLGGFTIPLNIDFYFNWTTNNPNQAPLGNTFATLDGNGRATATFTMPVGGILGAAGLTLTHAYGVVDPILGVLDFVSDPTSFDVAP